MSYSYFGWEDEFKGLTKDTNFSGSAEEDSKPQGLGSKPKVVETSEEEDTQELNLFSIIKRIANNFAESVDNDEERKEYLELMGMDEPVLNKIIFQFYRLQNLFD